MEINLDIISDIHSKCHTLDKILIELIPLEVRIRLREQGGTRRQAGGGATAPGHTRIEQGEMN